MHLIWVNKILQSQIDNFHLLVLSNKCNSGHMSPSTLKVNETQNRSYLTCMHFLWIIWYKILSPVNHIFHNWRSSVSVLTFCLDMRLYIILSKKFIYRRQFPFPKKKEKEKDGMIWLLASFSFSFFNLQPSIYFVSSWYAWAAATLQVIFKVWERFSESIVLENQLFM